MSLPPVWNLFGSDHLPYRMLLLARMVDRQSSRQLQDFGLTLAEWRVLALISVAGPASAGQIGTLGEIDRAEISRAVGQLEAKRLVVRTLDEKHKRRFIISPTEEGREFFLKVRDERRHFFRSLLKGLSETERETIERGLVKMAFNLDDG
jgi:DNA-binding MarR family transcriptional regulator